MRTENSLKNISTSFINNILVNILRFVSRTIFIKILGELYLGVNGILSNVLGILALADLGISSAISFSLYKPLAESNKEQVKSIMKFYKRAYFIIGTVVLVLGIILLPFLDFFVKDNQGIENLNIYYLVFLVNMVIGYYFSYKRTLMIADQKEYKITRITMFFNIGLTIGQIIVIYLFKNYLIYLLVQTFSILVENIFVNIFIDKNYSYLKDKDIKKLSKSELQPIKKNVKALIYHKIGTFFVDSTDNLIISKYIGLVAVGLYSNYCLIVNIIYKFISSALYSTTSSFGNLNLEENIDKKKQVFQTLYFFAFVIFGISSICFLNLFNHFIGNVWLDQKFLLSFGTVIIISLNFYVNGMMHVNGVVKASVGIFSKDKIVPLIQSFVNIVASLILVKHYGVMGVLMGTIISSIMPTVVSAVILYHDIFKCSSKYYFIEYLKRLILLCVSGIISYFIISIIPNINDYLYLIISLIISVSVPLLLIIIVYRNTKEYKDFKMRFTKIISKFKKVSK